MRFELLTDSGRPRLKRPNEKFSIGIDFTKDLEAGDTVATKTVTAIDTADAQDVSGALIASTSINGNVIGAVIQAGASGRKYRVIFKATTTLARVYEHEILVDVNAQG